MKRIMVFFALPIFLFTVIPTFSFCDPLAWAQSSGYSIQNVDHQMEVMYSGHVIIRDTIYLSGHLPSDFLIGFPKKYGDQVLKGLAYNSSSIFPMNLNVPFEEHSDLYGAKISFPSGGPQVFTVVFILSNRLVHQNNSLGMVAVEYPAFPSLTKETHRCNVTLVLPDFASTVTIAKDEGSIAATKYIEENLAAFAKIPAVVSFSMPTGILQIFSVTNLNRVITISPSGDVMASDNYRIVNNGNESLAAFGADVPLNASNIVGKDEFGRSMIVEDVGYGSTFRLINSTLIQPLTKDQSTSLTIEYTLPKIPSRQISTFSLNFDVFPYFDYYVTEGSVSIIPPEGATFLTYNQSAELNKNGFQETLTFNRDGICHIELDLPAKATQNTYSFNPLWLSYRPILWVWLLTAIGCGVIAFWKRSKTTVSSETLAPEELSSIGSDYATAFVGAYREKMRIASEITLLEVKARKGKISRRRYKIQKRKLKTRSAALSNDVIKLKAILFDTGGNNRALIRQLDSAETMLKQAGKEINDATSRHANGIISLEEYKKVLSEYQQRKENAESTINGILLRLREESR